MLVAPEENDEPMLDISPLKDAQLCTSVLLDVIEIGAAKYKRLNEIASTSSVPRPHGNRDRTRRKPIDYPVIQKLVEHMNGVEQYGEVEATRHMRMVTGELETRDNDDTIRCVPSTNMTKSGCYREYGKSNNYKLTAWLDESLPEPDKGEPGIIVSWLKYLSFWEEHYPHLKVGNASEDICSHCWKWR